MSEETPEEASARMDAEIAAVVEQMKRTWPAAVDFHVTGRMKFRSWTRKTT